MLAHLKIQNKHKSWFTLVSPISPPQVSLVNGATGELLGKTEPGRRVTSFYEGTNVSSILPLMTQPFDFRCSIGYLIYHSTPSTKIILMSNLLQYSCHKVSHPSLLKTIAREKRSIVPRWEELLLFNDDFKGVFEGESNKNIVMFFEVIDFVSMAVASKNFRRLGQKGGWYRIAWAFLKLVDGKWSSSRFGERVRLQLFRPSLRSTGEDGHKDAWKSWKSGKRPLYPATLSVTVEPVQPPHGSEPALRSMIATQAT